MKNLIVFSLILTTLFSCTKSDTPPPPPLTDSLLKSFSVYNPEIHTKGVVVLSYEKDSQIASLHIYSYDSSGGSIIDDSTFLSFKQADATTLPGSYDITYYYQAYGPAGKTDHHELLYDGQNQVIRDSITLSEINNFSEQLYFYDGNGNTTIESSGGDPQTPGSYILYEIDTMFVNGDNLYSDISYASVGGPLNYLRTRSFSSNINPLYNESFSRSLGCLLSLDNLVDFRSKNLASQLSSQDDLGVTITLNFVWTTDAAGRVIQGTGTDSNSGGIGQIYNFNY